MNQTANGRALITGASSGIGAALARKFAAEGFDLVLTARREELLLALRQSMPDVDVMIISQDLASEAGIENLCQVIDASELQIDILVNNAAIMSPQPFQAITTDDIEKIMTLNMKAMTRLTHHILPGMLERRAGKILNVASLASFHPIPGMDLYAATKAFVLSLTESLAENLKGTGVSITALCPGLTDTDALDRDLAGTLPPFMVAQADQVAAEGFDALMRKQVIRIPGETNKIAAVWAHHQPRWLIRSLGGLAAKLIR